MDCSTPGLPVHHQLPEFTQTHVHWVSDAIQPSHPLSSLLLRPSIFPSIRVFSSESALQIRQPKYWSFSFSITPSNEYSGLISFRIDWLDCLAVQGTLKSLLQHHSLESSVLWLSAFFFLNWRIIALQNFVVFCQTSTWRSNSHIHTQLLENRSFDYTHFCRQGNVSAFWYAVYVCHSFSSKEQAS